MRIAVVGSGIAGLTAALRLAREHAVVLFEADERPGGHVHTHTLIAGGRDYAVDSGFIVFNDWTYPRFNALLTELGIESQPSSMSFSVRDESRGLEYNGGSFNGLFAQRRNLFNPRFLGMLAEILRFNREAPRILERPETDATSLGELLAAGGYSRAFIDHYVVPMGAAIWSTDPARMRAFPARFFIRFLHNHGMLSVDQRPQWRVVRGGSRRYVDRLLQVFRGELRLGCPVQEILRGPSGATRGLAQGVAQGVSIRAAGAAPERFDAVFLACHADQALALLGDPDALEHEVLGSFPYQFNEAVLHTDRRVMPRSPRARAAWNYFIPAAERDRVVLTYDMGILQSLDADPPFLVTLNETSAIDPACVLRRMQYAHPLFTPAGVVAQGRQRELNGRRGLYFCGAYWRFGFHEDGVVSAENALAHFAADRTALPELRRSA